VFRISKEFHFCASHVLHGLPEGHPCARLHGHNYLVEIELAREDLDPTGFLVDYRDLDAFKRILDDELDHRHLNDILDVHPRAENTARWRFERAAALWPFVSAVRVHETPKSWAEYRPSR